MYIKIEQLAKVLDYLKRSLEIKERVSRGVDTNRNIGNISRNRLLFDANESTHRSFELMEIMLRNQKGMLLDFLVNEFFFVIYFSYGLNINRNDIVLNIDNC